MTPRMCAQQLSPTIRRVAWCDIEAGVVVPKRSISDPALGDWARRRVADCAWDIERPWDGVPEALRFEQHDDGTVVIEFALDDDDCLYGAADADASGLMRRGDHVHLATELHSRGRHRGVPPCPLCEERIAASAGSDDLDDDASIYGELHAPLILSTGGYGFWISNATHGAVLDLGERTADRWSFTAHAGSADIYILGPGTIADQSRVFAQLTGRVPVPPTWALGFIQSRFGYESFDEADAVIQRFRDERLPLHGVVFDVQWLDEHVNLKWNTDGFSNAVDRIASMHASGVRTVVITEPGTRTDASNYSSGVDIGAWGTDSAGAVAESGQWYAHEQIPGYREITPGHGALLNVFRESAADWWYQQHVPLIADGVDAWWLDLNEPEGSHAAISFTDVDWPTPQPLLHGHEAHNIFAIAQQRLFARRDRAHTNRRPFMLSRSGHAGSSRYGAAPWSGDVGTTWQALRVQTRLMLTAGLCGFPLYGCDLGGFHGEPEPELFARWLQAGTMFPICRAHGNMSAREPWSRGADVLEAVAPAIRLRGQLLPSLATWMYQACASGEPLVRPMLWDSPGDARYTSCDDQWMIGPLLAAPVLHAGITKRTVHFPDDASWINLWSGERHAPGSTATLDVGPSSLPVFVRAGTLLVVDGRPLERDAAAWPPSELHVWAFPDDDGMASCEYMLDDGISRDHEQGAYSLVNITHDPDQELSVERIGGAWPTPRLTLVAPRPGHVDSRD